MRVPRSCRGLALCSAMLWRLAACLAVSTSGAGAEPVLITAFDQPLLFVYGEWQAKVAVQDGLHRVDPEIGLEDRRQGEASTRPPTADAVSSRRHRPGQ